MTSSTASSAPNSWASRALTCRTRTAWVTTAAPPCDTCSPCVSDTGFKVVDGVGVSPGGLEAFRLDPVTGRGPGRGPGWWRRPRPFSQLDDGRGSREAQARFCERRGVGFPPPPATLLLLHLSVWDHVAVVLFVHRTHGLGVGCARRWEHPSHGAHEIQPVAWRRPQPQDPGGPVLRVAEGVAGTPQRRENDPVAASTGSSWPLATSRTPSMT